MGLGALALFALGAGGGIKAKRLTRGLSGLVNPAVPQCCKTNLSPCEFQRFSFPA